MKTGKAELVCTGSELLEGKLNLYAPLFHERLRPLGFRLTREQSSGDDLEAIADCIKGALRRASLVLVCGGLGPTFDDLTRQAAAKALGRKVVLSGACRQALSRAFRLRRLPPNLLDQARIVEGAKPIENVNGTAFGEVLTVGRRLLVLLPGPRREWEPMFPGRLEAGLKAFFGLPPLAAVKLRSAGLGEPQAERLLRPAMRRYPGASYTILAGQGTVDFIVSGDDSRGVVSRAAAACRRLLGGALYGEGETTLPEALGAALKARGRTAAAAESCTGGRAAGLITDAPGSSAWFNGGVVAYSNAAKVRLLGVKAGTLKRRGAVSAECAAEMAAGARKVFRSDYAFSVTGIAGPGGGTAEKPVGLVWFGLAGPRGTRTFSRRFRGDRALVRERAANFILDELRKIIE